MKLIALNADPLRCKSMRPTPLRLIVFSNFCFWKNRYQILPSSHLFGDPRPSFSAWSETHHASQGAAVPQRLVADKLVHVGLRCTSVRPIPLRCCEQCAGSLSLPLSLSLPPLRAMRGIPAALSPRCPLPAAQTKGLQYTATYLTDLVKIVCEDSMFPIHK